MGAEYCTGPVSEIVRLCIKYEIIDDICGTMENGAIPDKTAWRRYIASVVNDRNHANLRFIVHLYPKLHYFRTIVTPHNVVCWWKVSKDMPHFKPMCKVMVNLICGTCVLAMYKNTKVPRTNRTCKCCNLDVVEDLYHFIIECPKFNISRNEMHEKIYLNLSTNGKVLWNKLSGYVKAPILLGMEYPFEFNDLCTIRILSCIWTYNTYNQRLYLDKI